MLWCRQSSPYCRDSGGNPLSGKMALVQTRMQSHPASEAACPTRSSCLSFPMIDPLRILFGCAGLATGRSTRSCSWACFLATLIYPILQQWLAVAIQQLRCMQPLRWLVQLCPLPVRVPMRQYLHLHPSTDCALRRVSFFDSLNAWWQKACKSR